MKTLSKEEYDFMSSDLVAPCKGGCGDSAEDPSYHDKGYGDMVTKLKASLHLESYRCGPISHCRLTPLGKSAMQCYEFAHSVMDLALSP
jgi:hypothetical protein